MKKNKAKRLENTWTTKDGREIKVVDMTTQHISNTISMLRRKLETLECASCYMPSGDMAQYYAEQEMESSFESIHAFNAWILIFENELVRRRTRDAECCDHVCI